MHGVITTNSIIPPKKVKKKNLFVKGKKLDNVWILDALGM